MAEVVDVEGLLKEISEENPAGKSLREDPDLSMTFYQIRDARKTASDNERRVAQYEMLSEEDRQYEEYPAAPDWDVVVELSEDILKDDSKDLWVAAWMLEALVRKHGFVGLRDGYRLMQELCEKYWETIFPRPDEDDGMGYTFAQVASLNDLLPDALRQIPLTLAHGAHPPLTSLDYLEASSIDSDADEKAKREASGGVTLETFDRVANECSAEFFLELVNQISEAEQQVRAFSDFVDAKFDETDAQGDPPACSRITTELSEIEHRIRSFAKNQLATVEDVDESASAEDGEGGGASAGGVRVSADAINSRAEAFRALNELSEFFRRTEPHSPVSYALEQVVRWGSMSLPALLRELISDSSVRDDLFRRTGIEVRAEGEEY